MKNIELIGDYGKDEHTIRNNEQLRVPVMGTGIAARVPIPDTSSCSAPQWIDGGGHQCMAQTTGWESTAEGCDRINDRLFYTP
jgi:hypothetical protein